MECVFHFQLQRTSLNLLRTSQRCCYATSTSNPLTGKGKKPWDKRFPVHPKDLSERKKGGNRKMQRLLNEQIVPPTGVVDRRTNQFVHVREMIPQFVVPDLDAFELKPYVSYLAKEISQNKLTPNQMFNSVYASKVEMDYHAGKIKVEDGNIRLEDGTLLKLDTGHLDSSS